MSDPIFLDIEKVMDVMLAEVPSGVFSEDRADNTDIEKRSFSSAELRAHAAMLADLYGNLNLIYQDKFISISTSDGLTNWEKDFFSDSQDGSKTILERRQNVLSKLRSQQGINVPSIQNIVSGILDPLGIAFNIVCWSGQTISIPGTWILGDSALDVSTILGVCDPLYGEPRTSGLTPIDCALDYTSAGITQTQLDQMQETAYTYEIDIFGNASSDTLALLYKQLTKYEPARSTHIIRNNQSASLSDLDLGTFLSDTLVDVLDCGYLSLPSPTYDYLNLGGF